MKVTDEQLRESMKGLEALPNPRSGEALLREAERARVRARQRRVALLVGTGLAAVAAIVFLLLRA